MNKIFSRQIQIRFHDADPAGIVYFANLFTYAHDTFEEFIVSMNLPWKAWFRENPYLIPIRHAECDFLAPFFAGETYEVTAQVRSLSESSFQMQYTFRQGETCHAMVKMVHTFADKKTKMKTNMPAEIHKKLESFLAKETA